MNERLEEVKATLLSNEIMKRPNLEEDTSLGLLTKERGRSRRKGGRKSKSEFESESSDQSDNGDGCYFCKKPGHIKDHTNYKA